jgi:hypothetical protein
MMPVTATPCRRKRNALAIIHTAPAMRNIAIGTTTIFWASMGKLNNAVIPKRRSVTAGTNPRKIVE